MVSQMTPIPPFTGTAALTGVQSLGPGVRDNDDKSNEDKIQVTAYSNNVVNDEESHILPERTLMPLNEKSMESITRKSAGETESHTSEQKA